MSGSNAFPGRAGFNSNPFGLSSGDQSQTTSGFGSLREEDENESITSPTSPSFSNANSLFGNFGGLGGAQVDGPSSTFGSFNPPEQAGLPSNYNTTRRTSVSAESLTPTANSNSNWTPPVHDKSEADLEIIMGALVNNPLFQHLDKTHRTTIAMAMDSKDVPAANIKVMPFKLSYYVQTHSNLVQLISQGDDGDYFYVVKNGSFDVYIHPSGQLLSGPDGMGKKVATIPRGGSFGDLALMYQAPRNATVLSVDKDCKVFRLDRITFRQMVMDKAFGQRRMYEDFLKEVEIFSTLDEGERNKLADALRTQEYAAGSSIITEGEIGDAFYILESGEAQAFISAKSDAVRAYKKGDYFGELALLNDAPRAATIVCKTDCKVARLDKAGFQRLLGPVEELMRRNKYDDDVDPLASA